MNYAEQMRAIVPHLQSATWSVQRNGNVCATAIAAAAFYHSSNVRDIDINYIINQVSAWRASGDGTIRIDQL